MFVYMYEFVLIYVFAYMCVCVCHMGGYEFIFVLQRVSMHWRTFQMKQMSCMETRMDRNLTYSFPKPKEKVKCHVQ